MPVVLMKPRQIVRVFTYRGTVLEAPPPRAQLASPRVSWAGLRAAVRAQQPWLSAPQAGSTRLCPVCRGPAGSGRARCFQCDLHWQCAASSLADVVVPVAFAIKGTVHARRLWQYKSPRVTAPEATAHAATIRAMLLVFLRDHGPCLWRSAGSDPPTHVAVVPTARRRPGKHPLRSLLEGYLTIPWARLVPTPDGERLRDLDPDRFRAARLPAARVLLIDDTWTTGSSAQSAAMALRAAGVSSVVTVVLGRHVSALMAGRSGLGPAAMPFRMDSCAAHQDHPVDSRP
jgi:hypothetical protein